MGCHITICHTLHYNKTKCNYLLYSLYHFPMSFELTDAKVLFLWAHMIEFSFNKGRLYETCTCSYRKEVLVLYHHIMNQLLFPVIKYWGEYVYTTLQVRCTYPMHRCTCINIHLAALLMYDITIVFMYIDLYAYHLLLQYIPLTSSMPNMYNMQVPQILPTL